MADTASLARQCEPVCPVCGGNNWSAGLKLFDDRYGHPGTFVLGKCDGCGHRLTLPMLREAELGPLYSTYYPRKVASVPALRQQAEEVKKPLAAFRRWLFGTDNQGQYEVCPGDKVLDVGCGSCLSLLEAKNLGALAWGIETDPNVQRLARELEVPVHQGSLHDHPFPGKSFDLIVLNQVIEHIPEPALALQELRSRLSAKGRLIVVFPNAASLQCRLSGSRWINWHIPYHQHHFTRKTFAHMAQRAGYRVVRQRTVTPNLWSLLQLQAVLRPARQGEANPLWEVPSSNEPSPVMRKSLKQVLLDGLLLGFSLLNRPLDLMGMGDSLMVELKRDDGT